MDAKKFLSKGKEHPAATQLLAFVNKVQDFTKAGKLTPEKGQPLIDAALALFDRIMAGG